MRNLHDNWVTVVELSRTPRNPGTLNPHSSRLPSPADTAAATAVVSRVPPCAPTTATMSRDASHAPRRTLTDSDGHGGEAFATRRSAIALAALPVSAGGLRLFVPRFAGRSHRGRERSPGHHRARAGWPSGSSHRRRTGRTLRQSSTAIYSACQRFRARACRPSIHAQPGVGLKVCLVASGGTFKVWSAMSDRATDRTRRAGINGGCPATTIPRPGSAVQRQPPALLHCGCGLPCLASSSAQPSRSGCT